VFLTLKNPIEMKKEHGTTVQSKRVHDRTTVVYSDCLPPPFPLQQRIRDGKSSTAAAPRLNFLLVRGWQRRRESIIQWTVDQPWTADDRSKVNGGRWIFDGKEKEQLTDMSLISF
jgi:hypothetical protein